MRKLTDLAVCRKVATAAIAGALVVLGVLSLTRLPVDFLPNIAYPLIKVHIWWSGATPEEIEEQIADVIEREMASVEGLDYLESSSIEGGYTLQVNFRYGVDVNVAFQDVQAAIPLTDDLAGAYSLRLAVVDPGDGGSPTACGAGCVVEVETVRLSR